MSIPTNELWWRCIPLFDHPIEEYQLPNVIDRILKEFEPNWPSKPDKARKLFEILKSDALDNRDRSAAAIALYLDKKIDGSDRRTALIYVAALLGNPIAILAMLKMLRDQSRYNCDKEQKADLKSVSTYWEGHYIVSSIDIGDIRRANASIDTICEFRLSGETPAELVRFLGDTNLKVITEIGDSVEGEGRKLARTYAGLLEPLPLKASALASGILEAQLNYEFPWLEELTDSLIRKLQLRANVGLSWLHMPPTLLVGAPGCGKTRYLRRLAELTGCGHQIISVGGSTDNRMLAGTARGWSSTQPCLPLVAMHTHGLANPIMIVDEVEKAQTTHNGGIHESLLSFLERESSRCFYDECLLAKANLSEVSWFATANSLEGIPEPLLSRFNISWVPGPRAKDFDTILNALRNDYAQELGIQSTELPQTHETVRSHLHIAFANGKSIRVIKRALAAAIERGEWHPLLH